MEVSVKTFIEFSVTEENKSLLVPGGSRTHLLPCIQLWVEFRLHTHLEGSPNCSDAMHTPIAPDLELFFNCIHYLGPDICPL